MNKEQSEALSVVSVLIRIPNAFFLFALICFGPILGLETLFDADHTVLVKFFVVLAVATLITLSVLTQKRADHIAARTFINFLLFTVLKILSGYLEM
jgi:hypothetical protein